MYDNKTYYEKNKEYILNKQYLRKYGRARGQGRRKRKSMANTGLGLRVEAPTGVQRQNQIDLIARVMNIKIKRRIND